MNVIRSEKTLHTIGDETLKQYFIKEELKARNHKRNLSYNNNSPDKKSTNEAGTKTTISDKLKLSRSLQGIGIEKGISLNRSRDNSIDDPSRSPTLKHIEGTVKKPKIVFLNKLPYIVKSSIEVSINKRTTEKSRPEFQISPLKKTGGSIDRRKQSRDFDRINSSSKDRLTLNIKPKPRNTTPRIPCPIKLKKPQDLNSAQNLYYFDQLQQFLIEDLHQTDRHIHFMDLMESFSRRNEIDSANLNPKDNKQQQIKIEKSKDRLLVLDIDDTILICSKEKRKIKDLKHKVISVSVGGVETRVQIDKLDVCDTETVSIIISIHRVPVLRYNPIHDWTARLRDGSARVDRQQRLDN